MSARYLLDTCVLSEPVAKRPHPAVLDHIREFENEIVTAAPVMHEMWFGCRRLPASSKRRLLEAYLEALSALPVLSYDHRAARRHGEERARLEATGQPASFADGQIAAIAEVNKLVLVTRNVGDFQRFSSLEIEDWFA